MGSHTSVLMPQVCNYIYIFIYIYMGGNPLNMNTRVACTILGLLSFLSLQQKGKQKERR